MSRRGPSDREALRALLRTNLSAFIRRCFHTLVPSEPYRHSWHIEAIAYELERIRLGLNRRLIITLPPRSLKSVCASVAFPAFVLGHDPTARILGVSYAHDLSLKHARDQRALMRTLWYRQAFPRTRINPRNDATDEYETMERGYRLSTSVGGVLTGRGAQLIVIDDPLKPDDAASKTRRDGSIAWYESTLSSRLDDKTQDAIVIIQQRLHMDDLVGHLLRQSPLEWTHLNLPAIAVEPEAIPIGPDRFHHREIGDLLHPEREPQWVLDDLKRAMGSQRFSAQYQQAPVPPEGALVRKRWLRHYTVLPELRSYDRIVQSWDTASRAGEANDYSVCTTWLKRDREYYLIDVLRVRLEYPDLRRRIVDHAERYDAHTVLIEDASSGTHLIQDFLINGPIRPIGIRPERDKIVRMEAQTGTIESGAVLIPESALWLDDFLDELLSFPYGHFDDQVDSISQFLNWAENESWKSEFSIAGF